MPTKKPRIAITLEPHYYEIVSRLSQLTGDPKSKILSELFETVAEPLMRTVALLEAAQSAPAQVKAGLRSTVEQIEKELTEVAGTSMGQMDWLIDMLRGGSQAAAGERPRPAPAPETGPDEDGFEAYCNSRMKPRPPLCNTGVRSRKTPGKTKPKTARGS